MNIIDIKPITIYKQPDINTWINHSPKYGNKIGYVLEDMFAIIITYINKNKLKLKCNTEDLWNLFVNFVYMNKNVII